ncbi:hypothetical protein BCT06_06585 [Vibrio breoganii]|nr:hypothetical protein A6D95_11340 [Vibrio breoganii]PMO63465.1 hypothetical protein BCT06_06585 [Vibrio breoganii]
MQRLFENKGANTKDRAPMKQMIKRGLVYAIHTYIREISCQLSAVSCQPQAASRKLQVASRKSLECSGTTDYLARVFKSLPRAQSPEPRAQSLGPISLEPCIPSKIVIICLLKCNLLVMQ